MNICLAAEAATDHRAPFLLWDEQRLEPRPHGQRVVAEM
jgi:hypothetical protein